MNKGQLALLRAMKQRGAARALAAKLGCHQSVVSRWALGRKPEAAYRILLQQELGIGFAEWEEEVEDDRRIPQPRQ